MTIYEKPRSEVFASKAPESEVSDFTAWLRGLGIAFDETNGLPEMSGLNNVFNLLNQYIKYLEQNGFAEWSNDLEYPVGAGVRVGAVWYRAKTQNTNKTPSTSQNDWEVFLNASALQYENPIYFENNIVKIRNADQAQRGVVQFANATEVAQKANVSKVVNPANVAQMFSSNNEPNGWVRLPNNLILQWGLQPSANYASTNVEFNTPFTQCLSVSACGLNTSRNINTGVTLNSFTNTRATFNCFVGNTGNVQKLAEYNAVEVRWFAIGY